MTYQRTKTFYQEPITIFVTHGKTEEEQRNYFIKLFKDRRERRAKLQIQAIKEVYGL